MSNITHKTNSWKLPLYKIYTDDEDLNLITKIVKRGTDWAIGPEISEFENAIKNYVGCDYCATLNSGTSALHATFLAYDFKNGDEIIVPSFSFISTANSVLFVNSIPVFSDIEENSFGLDPEEVEKKITSRTKCIVPMHYGGNPCELTEIRDKVKDDNIIIVEDAAEALGASIDGKKIGSISDSTIFSFCGNKVLTTGEGGAVTTNSKKIYEKICLIRSHGRMNNESHFINPDNPEHVQLGYNWRMSSLTASLGITQLHKIEKIIKMRQENAAYITSRIGKNRDIITPKNQKHKENIFQMYTIRLPNEDVRDKLQRFLTVKKIMTKIYFKPIHKMSFFQKTFSTNEEELKTTNKISNQVLTLPIYPNMTNEEKEYLTEAINEFFEIRDKNDKIL